MVKPKNVIQIVWGLLLMAAGIGVFLVLPGKMAQLAEAGRTDFYILFTRLCFYLIAILLVGGGAGKIIRHLAAKPEDDAPNPHQPLE